MEFSSLGWITRTPSRHIWIWVGGVRRVYGNEMCCKQSKKRSSSVYNWMCSVQVFEGEKKQQQEGGKNWKQCLRFETSSQYVYVWLNMRHVWKNVYFYLFPYDAPSSSYKLYYLNNQFQLQVCACVWMCVAYYIYLQKNIYLQITDGIFPSVKIKRSKSCVYYYLCALCVCAISSTLLSLLFHFTFFFLS